MTQRYGLGVGKGILVVLAIRLVVGGDIVHATPPGQCDHTSRAIAPGESPPEPRTIRPVTRHPIEPVSVAAVGTGSDNCGEATLHAVSVPGMVSVLGNNSTATGPDDCVGNAPTWWESFTITQRADVEISFCGSTPLIFPDSAFWGFATVDCLTAGCEILFVDSHNTTNCSDGNVSLLFACLPAGTYHYPILSQVASDYQMNISTSECIGACCNPAAGTCAEFVTDSDCSGAGDQLFPNETCYSTGCQGACCNPVAGTCTEDVTEPNCSGPGDQWFSRQKCLATGCIGACCNLTGGTCVNNVTEPNCLDTGDQWFPTQACLEAGCTGACCNATALTCTEEVTEPNCAGAGDQWFSAQTCVTSGCQGSCCRFEDQTCDVNVFGSQCQNAGDQFSSGMTCCDSECRDFGASEYDALGVKLLSRVSRADFSDDFGSSHSSAYDIWGYTSPGGREYAIISLSEATAFVDVTDPICPVIVEQIPGDSLDVKTLGSYALVVSDHVALGLQVIDMSMIDNGVVTLATTANPGGFTMAHNIAVNEDSAHAYIVLTDLHSGFTAIDLADPLNPVAVGDWTEGWVHDMQVVSYTAGPYAGREIAFVCGGFGATGFTIVDVTDKSNMFTRGSVAYPNVSTPHQGWLSEDRRYFFFGDEGDESFRDLPTTTYVFDVQDIDNPFLHTTFTNNLCSIDHNQMVRGTTLYQGNYTSGLRVYDISDVDNIQEIAYFDTYPGTNTGFFFDGAWGAYPLLPSGVILVSDRARGLFVLEECEGVDCEPVPPCCPAIDAPDPPAVASHADQSKNRYLSIVPTNPGRQTALQVTMVSSTPFPADVGKQWWVGPPQEVCENSGQGLAVIPDDCGPAPGAPQKTMWSAALTCTQTCLDWTALTDVNGNALDVLHIGDSEIPSGSSFEIRAIDCECSNTLPNDNYSVPWLADTAQWSDTVGPNIAVCPSSSPDGPPISLILDCTSIIQKFSNLPCAPLKTRVDLDLSNPSLVIDISDAVDCLGGFSGGGFPYSAPAGCP